MKAKLAGCLLLFLYVGMVYSQDEDTLISDVLAAEFNTRQTTPLIGEIIEITLVVTVPASTTIIEWPQFDTQWGPFQITEISDIEIELAGNVAVHRQMIIARLWEPNDYETPETFIGYQQVGSNEILQLQVRSRFFSVPSVLDGTDLELRPARGPIGYFIIPRWAIVAITIGLILVTYGMRRYWVFSRAVKLQTSVIESTPAQIADEQLIRLQMDKTLDVETKVEAGVDILRAFIHAQTEINAIDMTTDELKRALNALPQLQMMQLETLSSILDQADIVKFAQGRVQPAQAATIIDSLRRWIAVAGLNKRTPPVPITKVASP